MLAIEFGWLVAARRWPPSAALLRLLPGALMILALREALIGAEWPWVALPLALSCPAHLADVARGRPPPALTPGGKA